MDNNNDGLIDTLRQHMREMHDEIADLRDKLTACQTALAAVVLETAPGTLHRAYPESELPLSIVNAAQAALEKSIGLHEGVLTFHAGYPPPREWAALMAAVTRAERLMNDDDGRVEAEPGPLEAVMAHKRRELRYRAALADAANALRSIRPADRTPEIRAAIDAAERAIKELPI